MSDRHEMQAAGTHPAPCARHCESTAYEIEIRRLRVCLSKANEQAEHFEREWYLRGDEIEQLRTELAASRAREARMRGALRNLLALDVDHPRGADDEDVCAEVREARAALADGVQG